MLMFMRIASTDLNSLTSKKDHMFALLKPLLNDSSIVRIPAAMGRPFLILFGHPKVVQKEVEHCLKTSYVDSSKPHDYEYIYSR